MLVEYELAAFEKVKCMLMRIKWGLDKYRYPMVRYNGL